jgi:branched-chain amino acid transport system permease protein
MSFIMHVAPAIILFLVVTVSALPAIAQGRMLLLGTSAFYTAGAFFSVYIAGRGETPGTLSLVAGGLAGGVGGVVLAGICTRLRGDYFALATLCFAELLRLTLLISPPFPGPQGIPGIPRGTLLGMPIDSAAAMTAVAGVLLVFVTVTTALAVTSPWGAALQAVHDHEAAARTSGLPVSKVRLAALAYAGIWGGMAGALGVRYLSLADPESFALSESIMVLVVVLLSGRPSVLRCLVCGTAVATLSELLRFVATGAVRQIAFGALLFLLALVVRDDLRDAEMGGARP